MLEFLLDAAAVAVMRLRFSDVHSRGSSIVPFETKVGSMDSNSHEHCCF